MGFFSADTITDFARENDVAGVRRRLELGDDVNERRSFQATPLIEAAGDNFVEVIELLLDHGADMELQELNNYTALHQAIDNKHSEAAIVLARRGACADKLGYLGRTPLKCAIKRELVEVVWELLAAGANVEAPDRDGRVPMGYVQAGPNHDKLAKMLRAFSSLEEAIASRHVEAILVFAERARKSGDAARMLALYPQVKLGLLNVECADVESPALYVEQYEAKLLAEMLRSGSVENLHALIEMVARPDWLQHVTLGSGSTPLYDVVCRGNMEQLEYLLATCEIDPRSLSRDGKSAIDVLNESDADERMQWTMAQHIKTRSFSEASAHILAKETVTAMELRQLLGQLTSVYDLRLLFSLGFQALTPEEMHALLTDAFGEAIREKLTFDDRAAVFFKMGLQECRRRGYISEAEHMEWDLKATKVNVENSEWVRDIKRSLQEIEHRVSAAEHNLEALHSHFDALRTALIQKEQAAIAKEKRDRLISLVSTAMIMCGGPLFEKLFGSVFAVAEPVQLLGSLTKVGTEKMSEFLASKATELIFEDGVEALLSSSGVDPIEFAVVLQDAIKLEQAEAVSSESIVTLSAATTSEGPLLPATKSSQRFQDAVLRLKAKAKDTPLAIESAPKCSLVDHSRISDTELLEYPYHFAVRHSEGDLEAFLDLASQIDDDDGDVNDTLQIYARSESKTPAESWEEVQASALVFASYLGYVDIVKWFLEKEEVVKTEKKFLTLNRARSSAKNLLAASA
ncbi:hypothetical protein BBJ28_00013219 [Nothophytophthora sp. Chile5]|nr:hypothetical protein BBJ28_00013219 [Nothophytophthora sp. Chile5]